jgi:hypothetical protein
MASLSREAAEEAIGHVLIEQWDPNGARFTPGTHPEFARYAHEVYGLLLRGGSDVQVERFLRRIAHEELHRPDPAAGELDTVVHALRAIERTM